jgi:hypothetical protein
MKEKSPDTSATKRRIRQLVVPVILVVVPFSGDRGMGRRYQPGRVTLWVAVGRGLSMCTGKLSHKGCRSIYTK